MLLKTLLLGGLASFVAVPAMAADLSYPAAPPPAASPIYSPASLVTGDIALSFGWFDPDEGDSSAEFVGNGRVNFPFWNGWNETLELGGLAEFSGAKYDAVGGYSHTFYRTAPGALGIVLGGASLDGDASFTAGIEGALFLPAVTLEGQTSYTWADNIDDFWTISGEARWYFEPNSKLSGTATFFTSSDDNGWMLTAAAEHRFAGTMFGLFANASWFTFDNGGDAWEALGGLHLFFDGGNTLQGHDNQIPFSTARTISF